MIVRNRLSPQTRRERINSLRPSQKLINHITQTCPQKIPITYITGITKKYNRTFVLKEQDKFIQQFVTSKGFVSTNKLVQYLQKPVQFVPGQPLHEDSIRRIHSRCANSDGRLTAEGLMRMAGQVNVELSDKQAKQLIKRYGKRKQFLSVQDCNKLNQRKKIVSPNKQN